MYEFKYSKYVTENKTRFAEEDEILDSLSSMSRGAGIPLYEKNGEVYVDNRDNHSMIIGPTGCGKSRSVCKMLIASIIEKGESAIINDPKGELYNATAGEAYSLGYDVRVLNLRDPEHSDGWNPFTMVYSYYRQGDTAKLNQAIDEFAVMLSSATANSNDRYWDMIAGNYLSSIIKVCLELSPSEREFTLENILPLCSPLEEERLKEIFKNLSGVLSHSTLAGLEAVLGLSAEKTKSCVYSVLQTSLDALLKNESVLSLFSGNDINLHKIGDRPTVIYLIYPDEKISMNNIVNLFLTQAYTALVDVCEKNNSNSLPIRVNFVLDEFSNLTKVESFDNRISESRSKNIRYHLFIQSMNQLTERYGSCIAHTILSNTTSWICFGSKEIEFLDSLSKLCGEYIDFSGNRCSLISSAELQYLEKSGNGVEVLILRQGVRPYVVTLPYFDRTSYDHTAEYPRHVKMIRRRSPNRSRVSVRKWVNMSAERRYG